MVIYEAARAIVNMKQTTAKELAPAVSVLQLFCSSAKPTQRFAAVRTLNTVAMKHPAAVTACNLDLENLITDVNRSIATLAITTLLKASHNFVIYIIVKCSYMYKKKKLSNLCALSIRLATKAVLIA